MLGVHVDVHGEWVMLRVRGCNVQCTEHGRVYAETVESMRCVGSVQYVGV